MSAPSHPIARSALGLGIASLLPFFFLASAAVLDPAYRVAVHMPLVAYGAVILAFAGALHWGIALMLPAASTGQRLLAMGWSAVPALLAWLAVMLPVGIDLAVLIAAFWVHFAFDYQLARQQPLPPWYLPLRIVLTVGATLSLVAALAVGTGREPSAVHPFMTGTEGHSCPARGNGPPRISI